MDNSRDRNDRLIWARARAGYESAADAARAMQIPTPTYSAHENGSRGFTEVADRYARFFRINYVWLMTGEGQPIEHSDKAPDISTENLNGSESQKAHNPADSGRGGLMIRDQDERRLLDAFRQLDLNRKVRLLHMAEDLLAARQAGATRKVFRDRQA